MFHFSTTYLQEFFRILVIFEPQQHTVNRFPVMSSSNNNSFQILLEAEQQASALVNEARQCKII